MTVFLTPCQREFFANRHPVNPKQVFPRDALIFMCKQHPVKLAVEYQHIDNIPINCQQAVVASMIVKACEKHCKLGGSVDCINTPPLT